MKYINFFFYLYQIILRFKSNCIFVLPWSNSVSFDIEFEIETLLPVCHHFAEGLCRVPPMNVSSAAISFNYEFIH